MSHLGEDFLLDPGPDSVGTLRLRLAVLVGVVALNLEVRLRPKLRRDVELGDEIVHQHLLPLVLAEVLGDVLGLIQKFRLCHAMVMKRTRRPLIRITHSASAALRAIHQTNVW